MQAVLAANGGLLSLPPMLSLAKYCINGKHFSLHYPPRGGQLKWPNSVIIRSEGSRRRRPQQRRVSSNKPGKGGDDELKRRSKSPDNEEIIALFRRIQSSISKEGGPKVPRTRRHVIADPICAEINQSTERGKEHGRRRGSGLEDPAALKNSETKRPLSKFVKRSPIPAAWPLEEQSLLKKEGEVEKAWKVKEGEVEKAWKVKEGEEKIAGSEVFEMQKIDDMKLSELKELARGQGIKGFSRLKKGELLQLLKEKLKASS